jgi:hypothetical protein
MQAAVTKERDELLAEKEKLIKAATEGAAAAPAPTDAGAWEKEKAELIKARDEVTEKLKVTYCFADSFMQLI